MEITIKYSGEYCDSVIIFGFVMSFFGNYSLWSDINLCLQVDLRVLAYLFPTLPCRQ